MVNESKTKTQVVPVDPQRPDPKVIARAAAIIRQGGLVAFPTETVYGLGGDALNPDAVARIFAAKGRPAHDPMIVHVADPAALAGLVSEYPDAARKLAARFWPGPLTLVLAKSEQVPLIVTAGGPTVAVRCPDHALALALIRAAGTPIAAPSANRFSHTSPTTAQHVFDDLAGRIDLILDGGPTQIGVESTVIDVSRERPRLLRPGGVPLEALESEVGAIDRTAVQDGPLLGLEDVPASVHLPSPGMLDRHYAPAAPLTLFRGAPEDVWPAMLDRAQRELRAGRTVGLLLTDEDADHFTGLGVQTVIVGSRHQLELVAQRLFGALRSLDALGADLILAHDFPERGLGLAINDRLRRAAHKIVDVA